MRTNMSLLAAILAAAAGCAPVPDWDGRSSARTVQVAHKTTEIILKAPASGRLAPDEAARLVAALAAANPEAVRVEIVVPTGVQPESLIRAVRAAGVAGPKIRTRTLKDLPITVGAILVDEARAVSPDCPETAPPPTMGKLSLGVTEARIGCATAANLAASVADPHDLEGETRSSAYDGVPAIKALDDLRAAGNVHAQSGANAPASLSPSAAGAGGQTAK
jgi:pilus biogenesis lipoprotein CpaD